eukprot:GHVT01016462.1.p1 GENE.GHVT01016462.1~~GHVT01016462.1.p1  ORF type:complete len:212 (-),score=41.40 GHVT01016462.1:551-1186(-)
MQSNQRMPLAVPSLATPGKDVAAATSTASVRPATAVANARSAPSRTSRLPPNQSDVVYKASADATPLRHQKERLERKVEDLESSLQYRTVSYERELSSLRGRLAAASFQLQRRADGTEAAEEDGSEAAVGERLRNARRLHRDLLETVGNLEKATHETLEGQEAGLVSIFKGKLEEAVTSIQKQRAEKMDATQMFATLVGWFDASTTEKFGR